MLIKQISRLFERFQGSLLLKSGLWYLIGRSFVKGITVAGIYLFTRLLSPEQYATVTIFLTWVGIFGVVNTLNVESAVYQARFDYDEKEYTHYLSALTCIGILAALLPILIALIIPEQIVVSVFSLSKIWLVLAFVVVVLSLGYKIQLMVWEASLNYVSNLRLNLLTEVAFLLFSAALIIIPAKFISGFDGSVGRILGFSVVSVGAGLFYGSRILLKGKTLINTAYWKHGLTFALPIIPHTLANVVLSVFDRILIAQYIGREEAGVYSLAYQIGSLLLFAWSALNSAWVPWMYTQLKLENYPLIRTRIRQYILGFMLLTLVVMFVSPLFVRLISPEPYWGAVRIVPIVAASYFFVFLYGLYASIEFYSHKTGYISLATILAAVINVVLNIIFLPRYGYVAAAWITLISYACMFLFHAAVVRFRVEIENVNNFPLMILLGSAIAVIAGILYWLGV